MQPRPPTSTQQQFLSFALSDQHWLLLSTAQLTEVLQVDPQSITKVPEMPSVVMGVCPWQGRILWVIDLRQWSRLSTINAPFVPPVQYQILAVNSQWGEVGYFIYQVGSIITVDPRLIQPLNLSTLPDGYQFCVPHAYLQGIWTTPQGNPIPIIDGEAIAAQIRSLQN